MHKQICKQREMIVWLVTLSQRWYHAQFISPYKCLNKQSICSLLLHWAYTCSTHTQTHSLTLSPKTLHIHTVWSKESETSSFNNQQCHWADIMSVSMVTPLPVGNPLGERLRQPWVSGNNRHGILSMLRLMFAHSPIGAHANQHMHVHFTQESEMSSWY